MTLADFRSMALSMNDAIEGVHMGHPDFRANGRIFATLSADRRWGMVQLTPDQQQEFIRTDPATFVPASGGWGRQGSTMVRLDSAEEPTLGEAMTLAWQNSAAQRARATVKRPARKKR
jgi:hypothetical protein